MTITALEYEHPQRRWKITRAELGPFNLLVGAPGAGKTALLQALAEICLMGLPRPGARHPGGTRRWRLDVQAAAGVVCTWEAEVDVQAASADTRGEPRHLDHPFGVRFVHERIAIGAGSAARTVIERSPDELLFQGEPLAVVKPAESAIAMLGDDPAIAPLRAALERVLVSPAEPAASLAMAFAQVLGVLDFVPASIEELREADPVPMLLKAHLARARLPVLFERIRARYLAMFEHVADVTVDLESNLAAAMIRGAGTADEAITLAIRERGVDGWIPASQMSSGMLRAFFHLAEVELAPRGTTIVIDGYAGDLGVRCLPALTDLLFQRQDELQLVLASQHPHVARGLPLDCWHVVTRRGGQVSVQPARDIPELGMHAPQEAFELVTRALA